METRHRVINVFRLRFDIDFWTRNDRHWNRPNDKYRMGPGREKYLHDSSAMVCSLTLTNEPSNRMGTKHRWQAKLTLTLLAFDIFYFMFQEFTFQHIASYRSRTNAKYVTSTYDQCIHTIVLHRSFPSRQYRGGLLMVIISDGTEYM